QVGNAAGLAKDRAQRKADQRLLPINCGGFGGRSAYCSSTILPLAYSKRLSFDRNDRPSRFSDSASSGSTMASTSRTITPPRSIIAMRARAALMVPLAVVTVAL